MVNKKGINIKKPDLTVTAVDLLKAHDRNLRKILAEGFQGCTTVVKELRLNKGDFQVRVSLVRKQPTDLSILQSGINSP